MQILKDEVKNKILEAAVEEFLVNGYNNSSLRAIASQAGITIGNIYSYFSSKDDLFETVVSPAWEGINKLMSMDFALKEENKEKNLIDISNYICKVFIADKERFLILMNQSGGSKFGNTLDNIIDFVSRRIREEFSTKLSSGEIDPILAKALASALLYGFFTLFNHYGGNEERLTKLIQELLYAFLGNIQSKQ